MNRITSFLRSIASREPAVVIASLIAVATEVLAWVNDNGVGNWESLAIVLAGVLIRRKVTPTSEVEFVPFDFDEFLKGLQDDDQPEG